MSKNYVFQGDTVPLIAPTGGVVSGQPFLVGKLLGVAMYDAAEGEEVEAGIEGVFNLDIVTAITAGGYVYWDDTAKNLTNVTTGNTKAGIALKTLAGAGKVDVKLAPGIAT